MFPLIVALIFVLIVVASVAFHFWSPWWWTPVASNWGGMDDTILLTFWVTGVVFISNMFVYGLLHMALSLSER